MLDARLNMTATLTVNGSITLDDLKNALASVPDDATVSIQTHSGDRFASDWHTVTFTWNIS